MDEIVNSILEWWKKHEYDTVPCGDGDWCNVYDEEPPFVKMAKEYRESK